MSTTVRVNIPSHPPRPIVDGAESRVVWADIDADTEVIPEGTWHLWIEGISTRGTEVTVSSSLFETRMMAVACNDDLEFALRIVDRVARWAGALTIDSEEFGEVPIGELMALYDGGWRQSNVDSAVGILETLARHEGRVAVPGPTREVVVGPKMLARLDALATPVERTEAMLDAIRRINHPPAVAYVFRATMDGGEHRRLLYWEPDVAKLLPPFDLVVLADGERLVLDRAVFLTLDLPTWEYVDEEHIFIDAASSDHRARLVHEARDRAIDVASFDPPPAAEKSRWWARRRSGLRRIG